MKKLKWMLLSVPVWMGSMWGCGAPEAGPEMTDELGTAHEGMIIGTTDWDTTVDGNDTFPYNGAAVRLANGCSGGFVAGQFLVTAAHCVGAIGSTTVNNRFTGQQTVRTWARANFEANSVNDWAILAANDPVGYSGGSGAPDFVPLATGQATTAVGYPGNLGGVLARSPGTVRDILDGGQRYGHDADITGGSSGSFMGRLDGGTFRVNGIQSWHWWPNAAAGASQMCSPYASGSCANAAVAISQFRHRIAEVRGLETLNVMGDFDGDGRPDMLVRDGAKMTVVRTEADGRLVEISRLYYGQRYGDWLFGIDDQVLMARDFDGDGRAEIFLRSLWGIGLIELQRNGVWTSGPMQPYGTRIGGWLLGLVDTIAGAGDFTPDGRQAFVIRSPWGIGLMRVQNGIFQNLMLVPHGTDFGNGWSFSNEDAVLGTLPMTYGQDRILLRNSGGVAAVYFDSFNGYRPRVVARLNDGQRFSGAWWFNRNDVIVTMGGDINNDGYGEFVIRSAWGIGVIDASLSVVAMQPFGSRAPGGWLLGVNDQIVGFAGVATGGGHSLVIQSPWGLGFLGPQGGGFGTRYLVPYGVRFPGGWLFGRRDRIAAIGNIDSAHVGEELVIRSAWGFGVLRFDTGSWQLLTHGLWPYGTNFGGWTLARTDFIPAR